MGLNFRDLRGGLGIGHLAAHEVTMFSALAAYDAPAPPYGALRQRETRPIAVTPSLGKACAYGKGHSVFSEGDRAAFFYKVVSGILMTCRYSYDGRRQIESFHVPGDVFGIEMGEEHRFSAIALNDVALVAYRRCQIENPSEAEAPIARMAATASLRNLERAQDHLLLLGRKNALERVVAFLLTMAERMQAHGELELPMSRLDIADHLGLTIETVSRSLTQLERQGMIEIPACRRTIRLLNKPALTSIAA
jgi:CRP/FNR family transcriptional regulator, nitrogen fixation regulation protein